MVTLEEFASFVSAAFDMSSCSSVLSVNGCVLDAIKLTIEEQIPGADCASLEIKTGEVRQFSNALLLQSTTFGAYAAGIQANTGYFIDSIILSSQSDGDEKPEGINSYALVNGMYVAMAARFPSRIPGEQALVVSIAETGKFFFGLSPSMKSFQTLMEPALGRLLFDLAVRDGTAYSKEEGFPAYKAAMDASRLGFIAFNSFYQINLQKSMLN